MNLWILGQRRLMTKAVNNRVYERKVSLNNKQRNNMMGWGTNICFRTSMVYKEVQAAVEARMWYLQVI